MKAIIAILILAAFLQSTVLSVDLVLIILILRSYIRVEKANYFLALFMGLFVSHLNFAPLGVESIIYLMLVQVTHMAAKSRFSENALTVVPLTLTLLSIHTSLSAWVSEQSIQLWPKVAIESFLSLPLYLVIKFWEERFVVRKDIKLRI